MPATVTELLLHRLEQRRLGLGRGPVDLVGEDEVARRSARAGTRTAAALRASRSTTFVPMMSAGIRSGVNWIRWNFRCRASASVRTSSVLPRPGHPFEQHVAAGEQGHQRAVDDLARGRR